MDSPESDGGLPRTEETRKRVAKANKACVPCGARKVKCDAAVIGLPCSSCVSRECTDDCVLPVRKRRTRKIHAPQPAVGHTENINPPTTASIGQLGPAHPSPQSMQLVSPRDTCDSQDCQSPRHTEPDLLYLHILSDTVKDISDPSRNSTASSTPYGCRRENTYPQNCLWAKLPQLDDIDNEFLTRKGVFDVPPQPYLDVFIKTYINLVHPFVPVISKTDFIQSYRSRNCSLFLLRVILTAASLHVPADVLTSCGFESCSAAQESFFCKAKLLHDFCSEEDPLLMLQGSIILSRVILDHPTDRDFGYWFHNAIRLATKLDLRNACIRRDASTPLAKMYRMIWWSLYFMDIFHVFVNTRHYLLLERVSDIKPITEDDWEDDASEPTEFLPASTPQQRGGLVAVCELSIIFGQCLSTIRKEPLQNPCQMMRPLDAWRKSLASTMHIDDNATADVSYLNLQTTSYRFETILCRLIRRCLQQSSPADWSEWVKQRLRSAILELDTIAMRVLASGTIRAFPISFVTTILALLALHIDAALDPAETDLVRSMARISISQTMLVLTQGREIPVLKRALPVFEEIISRKHLYYSVPSSIPNLVPMQPNTEDSQSALNTRSTQNMRNDGTAAEAYTTPQTQIGTVPSQPEQGDISFYGDFLGFDFMNDWQIGQLDFTSRPY